jgi:hypothetical protein
MMDRSGNRMAIPAYPGWITLPATLFTAVLIPVYWHNYGPAHFLWFSDIALFAIVICLWTGNRLLYSMIAVGVLPLEIIWTVDFLTGGNLMGTAAYMFDATRPLYLRLLSLFHLAIPPILIWMLWRQGYDRRALAAQTLLAWIVLPLSWLLNSPESNVNAVYGPFGEPQTLMPPLLYLGLYMIMLPVAVFWPMHAILRRMTGRRHR